MSVSKEVTGTAVPEEQTSIEKTANDMVPADIENMTLADEPMLCPPICIAGAAGGGFAAGAAVGCYTERCVDSRPQLDATQDNVDVSARDSVDDIVQNVKQ